MRTSECADALAVGANGDDEDDADEDDADEDDADELDAENDADEDDAEDDEGASVAFVVRRGRFEAGPV